MAESFFIIVLKVTGPEATMECQYEQLCAGLRAGIDGAVHRVQATWDEKLTTEDWGFFLIDVKNAFNEIIQVRMLWIFRQLWPSGAHFLNLYHHWSSLVLRHWNGTTSFLHSKEGTTQKNPLEMIAYRIGILPLIKIIKQDIPDIIQL